MINSLNLARLEGLLNKSAGRAEGPGNIHRYMIFAIDKTNRLIYISASSIKEILIFDFDGNFIKSFKVPYISVQLVVSETNNILVSKSIFQIQMEIITGTLLILMAIYYQSSGVFRGETAGQN